MAQFDGQQCLTTRWIAAMLLPVPKRREPFYEDLGRRLARLRQQRGMSQQALGALMDPEMTRASIANIETGQQRVLAHTLVQLASALTCGLDELVGERSDKTAPSGDTIKRELEQKLVKDQRVPKAVVAALSRSLGLSAAREK